MLAWTPKLPLADGEEPHRPLTPILIALIFSLYSPES